MLLTATIFVPLAGALLCLAVPGREARAARAVALLASLVTLALAVALAVAFEPGADGFQLGQNAEWVASLGVHYRVGVDGISLALVLLTALLTPLAVAGAWRMGHLRPARDSGGDPGASPPSRQHVYLALLLLLETALLGVFTSLDMLLFYLFWEAVLIPAYFLIGMWGGERRIYAAVKFFVYTLAGGLLMLVTILGLYYLQRQGGDPTFDYEALRDLTKDEGTQRWLLAGFLAAFLIKTPLVPFHTWLPDAYGQAPPTTTVLLAGVMSKMGAYGLVRFALPMLPDAARAAEPILLALAVISILYGALAAVAQRDFTRLVAYSSISHMGFVVLGLVAFTLNGVQGGVFAMIAHGLTIGGMFFMVGMLSDRLGTTRFDQLGGLQRLVPRMAGVMLVLTMASAALPGLVGFVGEFLALSGAFQSNRLAAVLATLGVILGAVYVLWAYQRMWHGEVNEALTPERRRAVPDLSVREWVVLVPLLAAIVALGLVPGPLLDRIQPAAEQVVQTVAPASLEPASQTQQP